jgi:hypothetical protein
VLAAKIHVVLSAPHQFGETEMNISVSIGISPYTSETEGSDEMLTLWLSIGPRKKAATSIASIRRISIVRCASV